MPGLFECHHGSPAVALPAEGPRAGANFRRRRFGCNPWFLGERCPRRCVLGVRLGANPLLVCRVWLSRRPALRHRSTRRAGPALASRRSSDPAGFAGGPGGMRASVTGRCGGRRRPRREQTRQPAAGSRRAETRVQHRLGHPLPRNKGHPKPPPARSLAPAAGPRPGQRDRRRPGGCLEQAGMAPSAQMLEKAMRGRQTRDADDWRARSAEARSADSSTAAHDGSQLGEYINGTEAYKKLRIIAVRRQWQGGMASSPSAGA